MSLPISVVIPHVESREDFFREYTLPSIKANDPSQILLVEGDGGAQAKRNKGAEQAVEEFLFFCDDDVILSVSLFQKLYDAIGDNAFAYCDYRAANHPTPGFVRHKAKPFDVRTLRHGNYVSTMSLIRRSWFPGFDESIDRLQDWDLFLTICENGGTGVYVPDAEFIAYWVDEGITKNTGWDESNLTVRRKHGI